MDDKIVLICATGRSGSTTMMRVLNTIPNSNICGENFGAINSLLEFYRRLKITSMKHVPGRLNPATFDDILAQNIKPAWYNSYNYTNMVHLIKMTIVNMFKNSDQTKVWGFKEIRYNTGNVNYLKEFKELFPQTKVIIQIRENLNAQSRSGWFKNDPNAVEFLQKTNKELIDFALANKEWCFLISFERMFNIENLKTMFDYIDEKDTFDEKKIKDILDNNIKD